MIAWPACRQADSLKLARMQFARERLSELFVVLRYFGGKRLALGVAIELPRRCQPQIVPPAPCLPAGRCAMQAFSRKTMCDRNARHGCVHRVRTP